MSSWYKFFNLPWVPDVQNTSLRLMSHIGGLRKTLLSFMITGHDFLRPPGGLGCSSLSSLWTPWDLRLELWVGTASWSVTQASVPLRLCHCLSVSSSNAWRGRRRNRSNTGEVLCHLSAILVPDFPTCATIWWWKQSNLPPPPNVILKSNGSSVLTKHSTCFRCP